MSYYDTAQGSHRAICFQGEKLLALVFYEDQKALPARGSMAALFNQAFDSTAKRRVLAGDISAYVDQGPIVCACHNVGEKSILATIEKHGVLDTQTLGEHLKCGTGCGSCLPELNALLARYKSDAA